MRRNIMIFFCLVLLCALVYYILSLISVKALISNVDSIFNGAVPKSETENTPLELYNYYYDKLQPEYHVTSNVRPIFTLHNFRKGYIWVRYEYWVYDENGKLLWGFANRFPAEPSRWTIKKENGRWEIIEISEDP